MLAALAAAAALAADPDWEAFRESFVQPDGRVVDTGQGGISHSEGQGFAMLLAVHYADRATFDRLWQWTRKNLQVRDDALLAWKWEAQGGVTDRNNASDADVLVAWSLARGAQKWPEPQYAADGARIARDVRMRLLKRVAHGLVIVPGVEGFDKPDGLTINLSYWIFPAFAELARADPAPEWDELAKSGVTILQYSYFGRWKLPPDWLKLGERVAPAGTPPERFGYDAVRIPLYLIWGKLESDALLQPYRDFWGHFAGARDLPAFTNLKDDSIDSYGATAGIRAIAQAVREHPRASAARLAPLARGETYYSAVLLLLTKVALRERGEP